MFDILETVQSMSVQVAVNIVRQKIYIVLSVPMPLSFIQGHNCISNLTSVLFVLWTILYELAGAKVVTSKTRFGVIESGARWLMNAGTCAACLYFENQDVKSYIVSQSDGLGKK